MLIRLNEWGDKWMREYLNSEVTLDDLQSIHDSDGFDWLIEDGRIKGYWKDVDTENWKEKL